MAGLKLKKGDIAIGYKITFFVLEDINTSEKERFNSKPKHGDIILRRYTHCKKKEILDYTLDGDGDLYSITIRKSLSAGLLVVLTIPVENLEIIKIEKDK